MPLDPNALVAWIIVTLIFIAVIGLLYKRFSRLKESKADEHSKEDEAPAY